ncbi:hypothetical protein EON77_03845, partial [bacterium]
MSVDRTSVVPPPSRASVSPGVPAGGLRLDELAREIRGAVTTDGDPATRVFGVRHDSREVEP